MYTNSIATPRLDLAGPIRQQDNSLDEFIAHKILPIFPVKTKSGNIPTVLQTDDQVMDLTHAPKTPYQRVQATLGNSSFACIEAGIEEPLSAEDYEALGQDQAEAIATERGKMAILRGREGALAGALTGAAGEALFAGQITQPASGENWGELGGKPIDDIADADNALTLRVGVGRRTLVLSALALVDLRKNEQIRAEYRRIVGQSDAAAVYSKIKLEALAQILGVDEILVASARKNTANHNQTAVLAYIWPQLYALLLRTVSNPSDLTEPALGRIFMWEGANVAADAELDEVDALRGLAVESYRDEAIKSDIVRTTEYTVSKILNSKCAELIKLPASD